ncbi:hypothetical protein AAFF_G00395910 [Aldrovandia affinis]|uniref:Uncharacterized protein n=1 Tax=Aldrovandia affinis TaxID=143900 RepID=A0AAD7WKQ3_9TELE|nr:hypothetical protein AAFF_G00395910 [Aldrovandia affinis]
MDAAQAQIYSVAAWTSFRCSLRHPALRDSFITYFKWEGHKIRVCLSPILSLVSMEYGQGTGHRVGWSAEMDTAAVLWSQPTGNKRRPQRCDEGGTPAVCPPCLRMCTYMDTRPLHWRKNLQNPFTPGTGPGVSQGKFVGGRGGVQTGHLMPVLALGVSAAPGVTVPCLSGGGSFVSAAPAGARGLPTCPCLVISSLAGTLIQVAKHCWCVCFPYPSAFPPRANPRMQEADKKDSHGAGSKENTSAEESQSPFNRGLGDLSPGDWAAAMKASRTMRQEIIGDGVSPAGRSSQRGPVRLKVLKSAHLPF